ncbi:uncharacterized protein DS421_14g486730 [Arachis hypogaea]|nr:uncharacterized protein DS421_14g486730 [Arachis hypogaea]
MLAGMGKAIAANFVRSLMPNPSLPPCCAKPAATVERRGDRAQSSPPHRVLLLPPSRLSVVVKLAATVTMETATIIYEVASSVRAGRGEEQWWLFS